MYMTKNTISKVIKKYKIINKKKEAYYANYYIVEIKI